MEPERWKDLVGYGILAPSPDNSQPWRFSVKEGALYIFDDKRRSSFLYNAGNRASLITMGAVIENINIAASHHSLKIDAEYLPPGDPDLVAILKAKEGDVEEDPLFPYIEKRCTNRKPYDGRPLEAGVREDLVEEAATVGGVDLSIVDERKRVSTLAKAIGRSDEMLFKKRELLEGLIPWIRWSREEARMWKDGMDLDCLELTPFQRFLFRSLKSWTILSILNLFGGARFAGLHSSRLARSASCLCLLTIPDMEPLSFIRAGRAVERVWLKATALGMAVQPMTGITFLWIVRRLKEEAFTPPERSEVIRIEELLKEVFPDLDGRTPAFLMRMGYAPPPSSRTLRRDVDRVLTVED